MKKVWIAFVLISGIFLINFVYSFRFNTFSEDMNTIIQNALILADTDYAECGNCINTLLEKIDNSSLLLYSFSSRSNVENIELAANSVVEYYKLNDTAALKHELNMIRHRIQELKTTGEFSLKNIL